MRGEKDGDAIVRHYRIYNMTDGGFYVSPRTTFASLAELIEHHSGKFNIFFSLANQNARLLVTSQSECVVASH